MDRRMNQNCSTTTTRAGRLGGTDAGVGIDESGPREVGAEPCSDGDDDGRPAARA
jgi:hypothetical protein